MTRILAIWRHLEHHPLRPERDQRLVDAPEPGEAERRLVEEVHARLEQRRVAVDRREADLPRADADDADRPDADLVLVDADGPRELESRRPRRSSRRRTPAPGRGGGSRGVGLCNRCTQSSIGLV